MGQKVEIQAFITSNGIRKGSPLEPKFRKFLGAAPQALDIALVSYGAEQSKNPSKAKPTFAELTRLGFSPDRIVVVDLSRYSATPPTYSPSEELVDLIDRVPIIYLGAGNTFSAMKAVKESGFDKVLAQALSGNCRLVTKSAGSAIAGQTLLTASERSYPDKNIVGWEGLNGLGLVPFSPYPHKTSTEKPYIGRLMQQRHKVVSIADGQAIQTDQGCYIVVGEPEKRDKKQPTTDVDAVRSKTAPPLIQAIQTSLEVTGEIVRWLREPTSDTPPKFPFVQVYAARLRLCGPEVIGDLLGLINSLSSYVQTIQDHRNHQGLIAMASRNLAKLRTYIPELMELAG